MAPIIHTIAAIWAVAILTQLLLLQKSLGNIIDYSRETGIKCQSLVNVGSYDNLKCAMMCMQHKVMTGKPCKAFNVTNSICTLCLSGPVSRTKQVIWSSTKEVYAVTVYDYEAELQKGLIIHAPFDATVGSTSPANGTTVTLMGSPGPFITSGKFRNALQVSNTQTYDDNKLSVGRHESDCLGNVTLCPDGVTISFWIYMFKQPHPWPGPISGPTFHLFCQCGPTNPYFEVGLFNGTHRWYRHVNLIYNHWHHFVFVYTAKDGYTWYVDGYRLDHVTSKPNKRGPRDIEMGCLGRAHCARTKYDDLRVWNEAKDENFIWRMWQS